MSYPVDPANCSTVNHCPNDRLEVRLSDLDETTTLHMGQWRYEKLSIRFDPSTTIAPPNNPRTIIAQVWQDTPNLLGPPLAVTAVDAGDSVRLDFIFKADPADPNHTFYSTLVPKSDTDFTSLCWRMKPSPTGPRGAVFIWTGADCQRDISLLPTSTAANYNAADNSGGPCAVNPDLWSAACRAQPHDFFNWGYDTTNGTGYDRFRISVGLYRPPIMEPILFWLDDVKLTTTGAALP